MNTSATLQQLRELRLNGMAHSYESVLQLPSHHHPEGHVLIAQLIDAERLNRLQNRTQLLLKLSNLRFAASLEELSFGKERNLSKDQIAQLADCSFISRAENILISGATGAGKSFLACALGHQACVMGYRTLYLNLNRFIEKIMLAKLDGSFIKLLNQMDKVKLLVLDDFGLAPMDQNTRLALLQILEDRYAKKSVLIASQLPVAQWHEYIGEPTLADAIMDRLFANAHRFELKGESLRKKSTTNSTKK
jgi:DNA replication protein DnaC